ncbi:MAG: hypothetical protein ACRCX2_20270 [Paraclostridium sp.]
MPTKSKCLNNKHMMIRYSLVSNCNSWEVHKENCVVVANHMNKTGDQMLIVVLDPRVRLSLGFGFNGRRISYDPIGGNINPDFELPESVYFLVYKLFPEDVSLNDILQTDIVKNHNDSKFRVSDSYGELYDLDAIRKFNKKLNTV